MNATFSAFSPLAGGTLDTYYRDNEYPYDLNGALDFTRGSVLVAPMPYPPTIGWVQGLLPMQNIIGLGLVTGKTPTGTWVGEVPNNFGMQAIFPNIGGGLRKVNG